MNEQENSTEFVVKEELDSVYDVNDFDMNESNIPFPVINSDNVSTISHSNKIVESYMRKGIEQNTKKTKSKIEEADKNFPFVKNSLIDSTDKIVYSFLNDNLPFIDRLIILTKVKLLDLIKIDENLSDEDISDESNNLFYKILSMSVDYIICDRQSLDVICAVELYGDTNSLRKNLLKIKALNSAGIDIKFIKDPVKNISLKSINNIIYKIYSYYSPRCPLCKNIMTINISNKTNGLFYKCSNTECRNELQINSIGSKEV